MNALIKTGTHIPAMSPAAIAKVRLLEAMVAEQPQYELHTNHTIHGGVYTRTIRLPAAHILTGALIKASTTLIVSGHVTVYVNGHPIELVGYNVLPASAGRKQAFHAHQDTDITMIFATKAATVEEIEAEFTDETGLLVSRKDHGSNTVTITGE